MNDIERQHTIFQNPTVRTVGDVAPPLSHEVSTLRACGDNPLEFAVLVPGGEDDMGPVRSEDGRGIG